MIPSTVPAITRSRDLESPGSSDAKARDTATLDSVMVDIRFTSRVRNERTVLSLPKTTSLSDRGDMCMSTIGVGSATTGAIRVPVTLQLQRAPLLLPAMMQAAGRTGFEPANKSSDTGWPCSALSDMSKPPLECRQMRTIPSWQPVTSATMPEVARSPVSSATHMHKTALWMENSLRTSAPLFVTRMMRMTLLVPSLLELAKVTSSNITILTGPGA